MAFTHLFSRGEIGGLTIKNRIAMEPLAVGLAEADQTVGKRYTDYILERARGGAGLITLEITRIDDETGATAKRQPSLSRDEFITPMSALTDAVHAEGAKIFCELHHPGRQTYSDVLGGRTPVGAGSDPCPVCGGDVRRLSVDEAADIVREFAEAALRAEKAGFDGVTLHAAHGYLINQFLSPHTNDRFDYFGGNSTKRLNFIKDIYEAARTLCGDGFLIGARVSVSEMLDINPREFISADEGCAIAKGLERLGFDFLDISRGTYESMNSLCEPASCGEGARTALLRKVRDSVKLPLIAVNTVRTPEFAEKMLAEGLVDFAGLGRALLADPEWPNKAESGANIRPCISCTYCFESFVKDTIKNDRHVECAVNPTLGLEKEPLRKDGDGRRVVIAGGGIAGLECARVLALRGFAPVIFERSGKIGGQINTALCDGGKELLRGILSWEEKELYSLGVNIRTETPATRGSVCAEYPYAVVIATGSTPVIPDIPGASLPHVITAWELLRGKAELKGKRVFVIGSGLTGLEAAKFATDSGAAVTVLETCDSIAPGAYGQLVCEALSLLGGKAELLTSSRLTEICADSVTYRNTHLGTERERQCDIVAFATGTAPVNELCDLGCKTVVIGDANGTSRIYGAIHDGYDAALQL